MTSPTRMKGTPPWVCPGHAADAYHRIDISQSSRHLVVKDGVRPIADTKRPVVLYESGFAPRWYVPRQDIDENALIPAEGQTRVECARDEGRSRLQLVARYEGRSVSAAAGLQWADGLALGRVRWRRADDDRVRLSRLLLHLRADADNAWIAKFTQQAVAESHARRPGGEAMLARMSEMIFVDAVRRYADCLPTDSAGWLAGLRDRFIARWR